MFGKPEWFKYRTFGWGLAPKTWQGWVYLALWAMVIGFTMAVTVNLALGLWIIGAVLAVLIVDVIHIMTQLHRVTDERENYHQLLIERNCSFAAIGAILAVALYQGAQNNWIVEGSPFPFDSSLIVILGAMVLTKAVSTAYVKWKL